MTIVIAVLVGCTFAAAAGFALGYHFGRHSAAGERQSGFPVLPVQEESNSTSP